MSYCRWSDNDFQCDAYVYEQVGGGFVIHVAGNRVKFRDILPPAVPLVSDDMSAWIERYKVVQAMLETVTREPIGLPFDGETIQAATAGDCADELERLRAVGYNVPQYAIEALRDEQAAADVSQHNASS
jgi:hypothetical protein